MNMLRNGGLSLYVWWRARLTSLSSRWTAQTAVEPRSILVLAVSETAWTATLSGEDDAPETRSETASPEQPSVTPTEMLRRAVRAISGAERERIGTVRLTIDDDAIRIVDSRAIRLRGADPVTVRQAAALELGSDSAVFGSASFGRASGAGGQSLERDVYAFLTLDRLRDYLAALDTLAVKLVEISPAALLQLSDGAASLVIDIRCGRVEFMLQDPASGAVLARAVPTGVRAFAEALVTSSGIVLREAVEALARRRLIRLEPAAAASLLTTTEHAFAPLVAQLEAELTSSIDYFVHQRLAERPERLIVRGELHRIRGLAERLALVAGLTAEAAGDAPTPAASSNLLLHAPSGSLKIGRIPYSFVDGRFRPEVIHGGQRVSKRSPRFGRWFDISREIRLSLLTQMLGRRALEHPPTAAYAGIACVTGFLATWLSASLASDDLARATTLLSERLAANAVLSESLFHHVKSPHPPALSPWTDKLAAVGRLLPDGIALTALDVVDSSPVGSAHFLICGMLPAGAADYIVQVGRFRDRLSADRAFMRGVADIALVDVSTAGSAGGDVATFKISVALDGGIGRR